MTARHLALRALYEINKNNSYIGMELKKQLANSDLSSLDKAFATELVYGVIKNRIRIDYIISKYSKQKLKKLSDWILNILRLGVYQIIFLDKIPLSAAVNESVKLAKRYGHTGSVGFVNGVLRNVGRNGDVDYPNGDEYYEIYYSHPKWLCDLLFGQYGDKAREIIENNNIVAPVTVRINTIRTNADALIKSLENKGINVKTTDEKDVIQIFGYGDISTLDEYRDGLLTPQGLSSYICAKLVGAKKNELILDLCSAPGGKTTAMAEMSDDKAKICAFDLYPHKVELIKKNCDRLGLKSVVAEVADATNLMNEYVGCADKVLADVPCSGLGIIRKKPDIKWNKESIDFDEIIKIQKKILNNADKYLKKGGVLVYSTCTVNKNENEQVINDFVKNHKYNITDMNTILPNGEYDGFFICRMIKE